MSFSLQNRSDMVLPVGGELCNGKHIRGGLNFISSYRVLIKNNDDTDIITGNNYPFYPFMLHFI